jgi:hypothetical protein
MSEKIKAGNYAHLNLGVPLEDAKRIAESISDDILLNEAIGSLIAKIYELEQQIKTKKHMELTINVNEQEAQMILSGLAELPAKHSIDLILKLKQDFESQIKESGAEKAEVVK